MRSPFCFNELLCSRLSEVRELVRSEEDFLTSSDSSVTLSIACVDSLLYTTSFDSSSKATLFFYSEEELPSLFCEGIRQMFDIVGASSGVNDLVEVRLFLEEELLVTCDTFGEVIRFLVGNIEGLYRQRVYTAQGR